MSDRHKGFRKTLRSPDKAAFAMQVDAAKKCGLTWNKWAMRLLDDGALMHLRSRATSPCGGPVKCGA